MSPTRSAIRRSTARRLALAVLPLGFLVGLALLLLLLFASILGVGPIALGGCQAVAGLEPVREEAGLAAADAAAPDAPALATGLDAWIARREPASPLVGLGAEFVAAGQTSGVDPRFLVAIAAAESGLGTAGSGVATHNAFGLGPAIPFASWQDGLRAAARTLGERYLGGGLSTIGQIGPVWAPVGAASDPSGLNANWVPVVSRLYAELGGDPAGPVALDGAWAGCAGWPLKASGDAAAVIAAARQWIDVPYVWGGNHGLGAASMLSGAPDPVAGFDCSSLVSWAFAQGAHIYVGDTSQEQWRLAGQAPGVARGEGMPADGLAPGDLVFTRPGPGGPEHVALYAGKGTVVVASMPGTLVHELPLESQGTVFGWARWLSTSDGPSGDGDAG